MLLLSHCKTSNLSPVKPLRSGSPSYHNWVTDTCDLTGCLVDGCQKASLSRLTRPPVLHLFPVWTSLLPPLWKKPCIKKYTVALSRTTENPQYTLPATSAWPVHTWTLGIRCLLGEEGDKEGTHGIWSNLEVFQRSWKQILRDASVLYEYEVWTLKQAEKRQRQSDWRVRNERYSLKKSCYSVDYNTLLTLWGL